MSIQVGGYEARLGCHRGLLWLMHCQSGLVLQRQCLSQPEGNIPISVGIIHWAGIQQEPDGHGPSHRCSSCRGLGVFEGRVELDRDIEAAKRFL